MMQRNYNPITGEITIVEYQEPYIALEDKKALLLKELNYTYNASLENGFYSSASSYPVQYGYSQNMQMIYSKWANVLALDPSRTSVTFAISNGQITLTRDQFIQFMNDAESFEINLFTSKTDFENQISSATTIDELNAINIAF